MYDVMIVGAGVSGTAVARELSRYKVKACVLEKMEDVCCGTSKANSGIVHAGYDAVSGSLKAKLNVEGNQMMEQLSRDLDFPFLRTGSLMMCRDEKEIPVLERLKRQGEVNHVKGLEILSAKEVFKLEPNASKDVVAALYAPTAGIVCPFGLNIALAENACENGVEFYFNTEVKNIARKADVFILKTSRGDFTGRCIVNAAGVYADQIHNLVCGNRMRIIPRRGEYFLLDKCAGGHVSRTVFTLPGKLGKGILVTPTVHGNLLAGPTAMDIEDKEGTNTTYEGLAEISKMAGKNIKDLPLRKVITSFAGLRAHEEGHDFIIREAPDVPGFFDCAGIESPGLTSAPAIGKMMAGLIREKLGLQKNPEFKGERKGVLNAAQLSIEERNALIARQPAYGNIICRCEMISEGEILDAVRRPLGARSLDGVKRRTRAGMGRCQSGFCAPRTMEILERELGTENITKSGGNSNMTVGKNKEFLEDFSTGIC